MSSFSRMGNFNLLHNIQFQFEQTLELNFTLIHTHLTPIKTAAEKKDSMNSITLFNPEFTSLLIIQESSDTF